MSEIESQLGKVTRSSGSKKVLTVDDQTSDSPSEVRSFSAGSTNFNDFESNFSEAELEQLSADRAKLINSRKEAQGQRSRIPEGIKRRLEILTGIGRLTDDVVVDGVTFSIRSLKPKENQEIIEFTAQKDLAVSQAFEMRNQTLARALYKIDGQDIGVVLQSDDLKVKLEFIQDVLEESLVNYLYNKYQQLLELNKKKFGDLGKTEEEVIENVKKL